MSEEKDPIREVFAANPDHPLVAIARKWLADVRGEEVAYDRALSDALNDCLPQPTFGERVLAHLPEGWRHVPAGGREHFVAPGLARDNAIQALDCAADPAAVADALLLLAGEKR